MEFIIKEWPNKSATLMTEQGYALSIFDSVAEARSACEAWYNLNGYDANGIKQNDEQEPAYSTFSNTSHS